MDTKFTTAQLTTRISTIAKRVKEDYEHTTAMDTLRHAYNCGDATLFTKLCVAMMGPSGRRRGGLNMITWGKEYFPIVVKQEEGKALTISLLKNRSDADWKFDEANVHPFDDASKAEAASVILGTEALLKIVEGFANKDNTTAEAHALAKTIVGEVKQVLGVSPEAAQAGTSPAVLAQAEAA